jgi:hypothetical protein
MLSVKREAMDSHIATSYAKYGGWNYVHGRMHTDKGLLSRSFEVLARVCNVLKLEAPILDWKNLLTDYFEDMNIRSGEDRSLIRTNTKPSRRLSFTTATSLSKRVLHANT